MSIIDSSLAGLTLDDVLGNTKRSEPPPSQNNTFLDSTRDEDTSPKDKKSWKLFRDKLRLRRSGSAWTSSIPIPTSDVNIQGNVTHNSRRNHIDNGGEQVPDGKTKSLLARKSSVRFDHHDPVDATMPTDGPPSSSFHPQYAHGHNSTGDGNDDNNSLTTWRTLSAREAVASQEAAEAAAAAEKASAKNNASSEVDEPVTMCLMDLLGESGYTMGEDDDVYYNEDDDEEESMQENGTEFTCCICKVNFTSSTFMPCGHEFCRLCSKEFSVERGNCSLCNGFVLEILEIF